MCPTSASRERSVNEQIRSLDGAAPSSGRCHFTPVGRLQLINALCKPTLAMSGRRHATELKETSQSERTATGHQDV
jgi:hypothetical protein